MRVQARLKPCTRNHPKIQEQVLETPQRRDCPLLSQQTVIIIIIIVIPVLIDCPLMGEKTVIKIIICWGWVVFYWAKEWAQRSSKDLVSVSRRVPAGWSLGKFQAAHCGGNPTPATPGDLCRSTGSWGRRGFAYLLFCQFSFLYSIDFYWPVHSRNHVLLSRMCEEL